MGNQMDKIGIAVIGSGDVAPWYVQAIQLHEDMEAVWCMDIREDQARRLGERFDVAWTTDVDQVLADPRVHAVIICVPHALHAELTIKAAAAGKHVMCDKPMSTNREDALAMLEACRKANVKLGINLASRCQPSAILAKDILARKVIGDIFHTKIGCYVQKPDEYWMTGWGTKHWRASKKMGGGGIGIMNMTHDMDRLNFCTGLRITQMKGESGTFMTDIEVEDLLSAVWRYDNGAIGTVSAGSNMPGSAPEATRVFGTKGQMELWNPVRVFTTREDTEFTPNEWHSIEVERIENDYIPYIADFVNAVRTDTTPPISGEDGFRILDAILGIYDSSETGKTVFMRTDI